MITPPRRSVTRFFIPLIDVLILLFAIFLLMPLVSEPATDSRPMADEPREELPQDVRELQRELREAKARIERLEKSMQARLADRLSVRVLQIDRNTGTLFYYTPDSPERQEIRTAQDALRLINQQKAIANKSGGVKDVFFLVLFPPRSSYPTQEQVNEIRSWFSNELIGFDTGAGW